MNKQHSSSVPDYAMCISILARGVPKHWIWKLVSINKEEITSCTLPDVLHHFRNKLINNLLCTLWMVHHVLPSSDRTVPSCSSTPPTQRSTPYHRHPRPGRAGRPDGQGHYSARVLASKLRRHNPQSTCAIILPVPSLLDHSLENTLDQQRPQSTWAFHLRSNWRKRRFKERKNK